MGLEEHAEIISERLPYIIEFSGHSTENGALRFLENEALFPNGILRCFWISNVKSGETRGDHAHYKESQVIVAMAGKLTIEVTTCDKRKMNFILDSSSKGLVVPPLNWLSIQFSENAVLLGLGDQKFSEQDYIRNKLEFDNIQKGI